MFGFLQSKHRSVSNTVSAAIQEFETGDRRVLTWTTDENGKKQLSAMHYVASSDSLPVATHIEYIHKPEHRYTYGVAPVTEHNFYHITDAVHRAGVGEHTLLSSDMLDDQYASWIALCESPVPSMPKIAGSNECIVSGLSGVSRLFGFAETENIVYVSFDRFESVVALIRGRHVLMHSVVPVGSSYIIQALTEIMNIDKKVAQNIFERHGCSFSHYDESVRASIIELLDPLIAAVRYTVAAATASQYRPVFLRQPLTAWICGGIGPSVPGMTAYIGKHIPAPYIQHIAPEFQRSVQSARTPMNASSVPRFLLHLGIFANR